MPKKKSAPPADSPLRRIPSVDQLLGHASVHALLAKYGRAHVTAEVRGVLASVRDSLKRITDAAQAALAVEPEAIVGRLAQRLAAGSQLKLRHVINATGIVLHTGLGRAVLSADTLKALLVEHASYSLLEVDPATNERRNREAPVSQLLAEIVGTEAATVVNNNAGGTLITLAALAGGREVIVARGQLVEIGGTFRLPDVMTQSGAKLVEVGATNKVYLSDYERMIGPNTALLMVVHTSNYRIVGFTEEPPLAEMIALGRKHRVPVFHDIGSGMLVDLGKYGIGGEPLVAESVRLGADVMCFSGDKLLGGPQAGIVCGRKTLVDAVRKHPLFRALRPDKLQLTALEATLQHYRNPDTLFEAIPTLRMVAMTDDELKLRARKLAGGLKAIPGAVVEVCADTSQLGGGSTPGQELPTWVVALAGASKTAQEISDALRAHGPPIFSRVKKDRCLFDPRTIQAGEDVEIVRALRKILA